MRMGRYAVGLVLAVALAGCDDARVGAYSDGRAGRSIPVISGPRQVVEDYLRSAAKADGSGMYALLGSGERDDETPESLRKTAADRYTAGMKWDVLKATETGSRAEVVVDFQGAKVDPNPTKFALTRENGEWRIVDSPELNEREKNGDIHIKF